MTTKASESAEVRRALMKEKLGTSLHTYCVPHTNYITGLCVLWKISVDQCMSYTKTHTHAREVRVEPEMIPETTSPENSVFSPFVCLFYSLL